MRILVAPQEFKGTLTAQEAAEAIAGGLRRALPAAEIETVPLADGGPGTVAALVRATGGRFMESDALDPLGRPVRARWGILGNGETAVIEMAAASGLTLLAETERDPARASTAGTGELLRAALDAGFTRILIGVGGSATNDGGAGLGTALGARLLDARGEDLPPGGAALAALDRIDVSGLDKRPPKADIVVATDVANPLCGPQGASLVYGPQKGANEKLVRRLDAALARYAEIIQRDLGVDVAGLPGAGAAGGLAAGLVAFCSASIQPGFEVVAQAVGLEDRVRRADLVITGEGRLDSQSAFGKTTVGVARIAENSGKPAIAVVGSVEDGEASQPFAAVFALAQDPAPPNDATARGGEFLSTVAETRVAPWIRARMM